MKKWEIQTIVFETIHTRSSENILNPMIYTGKLRADVNDAYKLFKHSVIYALQWEN